MDGNQPSLLLPERSRLLYIGPMKTGTTMLQETASLMRPYLYEHGVYYPGSGRNHHRAIAAFMQLPDAMVAGNRIPPGATIEQARQIPARSVWETFLDDINAESNRRVLISHEFAAGASEQQAQDLIHELGADRTHVVITLRPLWAMLTSQWTQSLKFCVSTALDDWLHDYFTSGEGALSPRDVRQMDQAGLVERWAGAAGAENVTVIIVQKQNPDLLTGAFEEILGLPERSLTGVISGGKLTNRSMSMAEAEVFRRLNATIYDPESMSWPVYRDVVRNAINHLLEHRSPDASEPPVRLPAWAADLAVQSGRTHADRIAASGVRVVGDLSTLSSEPMVNEEAQTAASLLPYDIVIESLIGAVHGAQGYEAKLGTTITRLKQARDRHKAQLQKAETKRTKTAQGATADQVRRLPATAQPGIAARTFTSRQLLMGLGLRLKHRILTRKSMPLR